MKTHTHEFWYHARKDISSTTQNLEKRLYCLFYQSKNVKTETAYLERKPGVDVTREWCILFLGQGDTDSRDLS